MALYIATKSGLVVAQADQHNWRKTGETLGGRFVTSVLAREGMILAGTTDGIFSSADQSLTWSDASNGLTIRHVRWLAYHPEISDFEFAGTEPAGIFISRDGGGSWRTCREVEQLRDRYGWWLPYSPEAGCVRGFAFHGSRAYAAVEVGAALRSDDGGESWRLVGGSDGQPRFGRPRAGALHPDVHSVEAHPSSPNLVFAATGGGFYRSEDGGDTWESAYNDCYVRAVWVDPDNSDHMILGPSAGPSGADGRIERTQDGGRSWHQLAGRWRRNMVERFVQVGNELLAVMANGQLLGTSLSRLDWQPILTQVAGINDVAVMEG